MPVSQSPGGSDKAFGSVTRRPLPLGYEGHSHAWCCLTAWSFLTFRIKYGVPKCARYFTECLRCLHATPSTIFVFRAGTLPISTTGVVIIPCSTFGGVLAVFTQCTSTSISGAPFLSDGFATRQRHHRHRHVIQLAVPARSAVVQHGARPLRSTRRTSTFVARCASSG